MHYEAVGDSWRCHWRSVVVWGETGRGVRTVSVVRMCERWQLLLRATVPPLRLTPVSGHRPAETFPWPPFRFFTRDVDLFWNSPTLFTSRQRVVLSRACPLVSEDYAFCRGAWLSSHSLFADDAAAANLNLSWWRRPQLVSSTFYPDDDHSDHGTSRDNNKRLTLQCNAMHCMTMNNSSSYLSQPGTSIWIVFWWTSVLTLFWDLFSPCYATCLHSFRCHIVKF